MLLALGVFVVVPPPVFEYTLVLLISFSLYDLTRISQESAAVLPYFTGREDSSSYVFRLLLLLLLHHVPPLAYLLGVCSAVRLRQPDISSYKYLDRNQDRKQQSKEYTILA